MKNYPMLGSIRLTPQMPMDDLLAQRGGVFGAGADAVLLPGSASSSATA